MKSVLMVFVCFLTLSACQEDSQQDSTQPVCSDFEVISPNAEYKTIEACSNDISGTWEIESTCFVAGAPFEEECAPAQISSGGNWSGRYIFDMANSTCIMENVGQDKHLTVSYPLECLAQTSPANCQAMASYFDSDFLAGLCEEDGSLCVCTYQEQNPSLINQTFTCNIVHDTLFMTADNVSLMNIACAEGDFLTLQIDDHLILILKKVS